MVPWEGNPAALRALAEVFELRPYFEWRGLVALAEAQGARTVVLSGGVFQNELLMADLAELLSSTSFVIWSNREVPPNDGGISLGQAALAVGKSL